MSVSMATFSESWTMKGYIQLSLHGFWLTGHSTLSSYVLVLMSYEMKEVRDEGMDVQVISSRREKYNLNLARNICGHGAWHSVP